MVYLIVRYEKMEYELRQIISHMEDIDLSDNDRYYIQRNVNVDAILQRNGITIKED